MKKELVEKIVSFLKEIAEQEPEEIYWWTCGQCGRVSWEAEDLLDEIKAESE